MIVSFDSIKDIVFKVISQIPRQKYHVKTLFYRDTSGPELEGCESKINALKLSTSLCICFCAVSGLQILVYKDILLNFHGSGSISICAVLSVTVIVITEKTSLQ